MKAICDDGFDEESARVACRELYGRPQFVKFKLGQRCEFAEFWLDNVECAGTEQNIDDCPHGEYGEHNCNAQTECI